MATSLEPTDEDPTETVVCSDINVSFDAPRPESGDEEEETTFFDTINAAVGA